MWRALITDNGNLGHVPRRSKPDFVSVGPEAIENVFANLKAFSGLMRCNRLAHEDLEGPDAVSQEYVRAGIGPVRCDVFQALVETRHVEGHPPVWRDRPVDVGYRGVDVELISPLHAKWPQLYRPRRL